MLINDFTSYNCRICICGELLGNHYTYWMIIFSKYQNNLILLIAGVLYGEKVSNFIGEPNRLRVGNPKAPLIASD